MRLSETEIGRGRWKLIAMRMRENPSKRWWVAEHAKEIGGALKWVRKFEWNPKIITNKLYLNKQKKQQKQNRNKQTNTNFKKKKKKKKTKKQRNKEI
jgi:hypothetical protein